MVIGFCLRGRLVKSTPEIGQLDGAITSKHSGVNLLPEALREYGHLRRRLFVAAPLRNFDSAAISVESVAQDPGIGQSLPSSFPVLGQRRLALPEGRQCSYIALESCM